MQGFYTESELKSLGFKSLGDNVLLSKKASFYNQHNISIGSNVRIDDFVILSGRIKIGNFVHIGAFSSISGGKEGVILSDFCGLSNHVRIFGTSDDYSGETMTNPCIPIEFKKPTSKQIILEKHCIVGSGSILLPNAYLAEGVAVGAMSLMAKKTKPWGIYFGIPAKRIKERKRNILELEKNLMKDIFQSNNGGGGCNLIYPHSWGYKYA